MSQGHKPTDGQRRNAIITGLALAAMALGVYLVVILRMVTRP